MKKCLVMFALVALAGCGGEGSGSAPAASGTGAATQKPADTAAAAASATAAAAAPAAASYKGILEGRKVIAFVKDPKDEAQCGVVTAKPEEKELTQDELKKVAEMIKGEIASTCPTENIVGACRAFGIAVQYYGPKYTADSAKKDCKGTWAD